MQLPDVDCHSLQSHPLGAGAAVLSRLGRLTHRRRSSQMSTYSRRSGRGTCDSGTCFTRLKCLRASSSRQARTCRERSKWIGVLSSQCCLLEICQQLCPRQCQDAEAGTRRSGLSKSCHCNSREARGLPREPAAQMPPGSECWAHRALHMSARRPAVKAPTSGGRAGAVLCS